MQLNHKKYLTALVDKKDLCKTFLFVGREKAKESALEFAMEILECKEKRHPDLHMYKPEGKMALHSIASIKNFIDEMHLPPYQAKRKVFILYDAERMLNVSSNALLKTLEEPSSDATVILLSSYAKTLLPTIVSRCSIVDFKENFQQGQRECACKEEVIAILSYGKQQSYVDLLKKIKKISEYFESEKKSLEKEYKDKSLEGYSLKEFSMAQQELYQKESDGFIAQHIAKEQINVLNTILYWYRDLHLLSISGNPKHLFHDPQYLKKYALKELPGLNSIQEAVKDAKLKLERSFSFQIVFENLLLKLF